MASGSKSITSGSDETFQYECNVCEYNNQSSDSISFCTVCTEYLCKACEHVHRGSKATRDHKILSGSNIPSSSIGSVPFSPAMYCDNHKTMLLNVYCENHDDVICGSCKLIDHRKCKTIDVKKQRIGVEMKEAFDDTIRQMIRLKNTFENFKGSREQHKIQVKKNLKGACIDDLQKIVRRIKDTIDELEKNLIKKESDTEDSCIKEIEDHVTIIDDALNQISGQIKSLDDYKMAKDDDIKFVRIKKANIFKRKYEDALHRMQDEIRPLKIQFKPNDAIADILAQIQSLGTIKCTKDSASVLDMSLGDRRDIDVGLCDVSDCAFIGDSHLVLACGDDGLKLLDKHFKVQSQLPCPSGSVATINENEVIITQGKSEQIQHVSIFPNMVVTQTLKMDRLCISVDVFDNEIFVICHDNPGNGEVRVLKMNGIFQRQLGLRSGRYIFRRPEYIKVSRDGSKVFISDLDTNKVTCLSQQGDVLYQYTDKDLKTPRGMYVDDKDILMVCGADSHNVHMIKHDGRKQKIMLSKKDGMKIPLFILYRTSDGCLVIGLWGGGESLLTYKTND